MKNPRTHTIIFSPLGEGKTHAVRTWPKPMLFLGFDPPDKFGVLRRGAKIQESTGRFGPVEEMTHSDGVIRVEHFHDSTLLQRQPTPTAFANFHDRLDLLYSEYKKWATVVIDSVTYAMMAARHQAQFVTNKGSRDPRQWDRDAADLGAQLFMGGLAMLRTNVVLICHVRTWRDEKGNPIETSMTLPGRLRDPGSGLGIGYGEIYRLYKQWSEKKQAYVRRFQTEADDEFHCATQIGAPNKCLAKYEALWKKEK